MCVVLWRLLICLRAAVPGFRRLVLRDTSPEVLALAVLLLVLCFEGDLGVLGALPLLRAAVSLDCTGCKRWT